MCMYVCLGNSTDSIITTTTTTQSTGSESQDNRQQDTSTTSIGEVLNCNYYSFGLVTTMNVFVMLSFSVYIAIIIGVIAAVGALIAVTATIVGIILWWKRFKKRDSKGKFKK